MQGLDLHDAEIKFNYQLHSFIPLLSSHATEAGVAGFNTALSGKFSLETCITLVKNLFD
jgi:hypothetical protein